MTTATVRSHGSCHGSMALSSRHVVSRRQYFSNLSWNGGSCISNHSNASVCVYGTAGGREEEGRDPPSSGSPSIDGGLTVEEAYRVLGLDTNSGYDDVLARKDAMLEECGRSGDDAQQKALLVEVAYDTIFSSQLKARLSGDLKVSSSVRFADVKRPSAPGSTAFSKLKKKVNMGPGPSELITLNPLSRQEDIAIVSAVFAALLLWSVVPLGANDGSTPGGDVPGLQIALGLASAVYFQREKKRTPLSKSVIIAVIGLVLGTIAGAGLESWLRVDVIPLLGISNPATVVGSFSLVGLYLSLLLLR